jgi:hypothetical protein
MSNALVLTQMLILLLERAAEVSKVIRRAQEEGRDVNAEELDVARRNDDIQRDRLQALIDAARSQ